MCGISGVLLANGKELKSDIFWIRRRGPDGSGSWSGPDGHSTLSHVRLSIIDPSNAGHQPMLTSDQRVVMVYNGEIYNYRELKAELVADGYRFQGHSDSEVLLHLFARDGVACFSRLNGIFAAAFWEQDTGLLTLVRDPVGVKPLYLAENADGLVFASEMKGLLRSGATKPELNPKAVLAHLGFLWSPGRATLVKGVHKVLPGHVIRAKAGRIIFDEPYRAVRFHQLTSPESDVSAAEAVGAAVRTAVERQMVSDVPLGAFLSGGLDSSAVAAFAQQHRRKEGAGESGRLQCFSIEVQHGSTASEGFAEDLPYARRVAAHIGVDLHVVQAGRQMMDRLPEMIYLLDEPTPDPAALNTLLISELARSQGIKVLLSGAGGDDIFTGYRRHFALTQERWWSGWPRSLRAGLAGIAGHLPVTHPLTRRVGKAFQYAGQDADHRLVSYFLWTNPTQALNLLHPAFRAGLSTESLYDPMLQTLGDLPPGEAPLNRMLYLECKHFLADHNLNYTDKMGMAAGVEVRVPLLDLDLMDLAGSLPLDMKQRGRVGKWIFKKAMEPFLPHDVIYRPKTGFGVPLRHWLQTILKPLVDDVLSDVSLRARGVFNPAAVQQLRQADLAGRVDATYTIFSMVCLELWCRQYMDGDYALDANL
jgi:asparagine synthase (glutamine-hydrolysing)